MNEMFLSFCAMWRLWFDISQYSVVVFELAFTRNFMLNLFNYAVKSEQTFVDANVFVLEP